MTFQSGWGSKGWEHDPMAIRWGMLSMIVLMFDVMNMKEYEEVKITYSKEL